MGVAWAICRICGKRFSAFHDPRWHWPPDVVRQCAEHVRRDHGLDDDGNPVQPESQTEPDVQAY